MSDAIEVRVPDIGDFADVPIVEVHVSAGDEVAVEDPLVTLESDKASIDVPSTHAGAIAEVKVAVDDTVSEGDVLVLVEPAEAAAGEGGGEGASKGDGGEGDGGDGGGPSEGGEGADAGLDAAAESGDAAGSRPADGERAGSEAEPVELPDADVTAQVVVLGSGPGGYTAAFRAADLGLRTVLVERDEALGGVCLNVGCIPSKALLHVARTLADAADLGEHGVSLGEPDVDVDALREWKQGVVDGLTGGIAGLAQARDVEVVRGHGRFAGPHVLEVEGGEGTTTVAFEHCVVATGSSAATIPGLPDDDERVMDSTAALEIADVPERLLVVGGGIIGLELATVYDALGSRVTVVELADRLIPGCDPDLVKPLHKRIEGRYAGVHLQTSVASAEAGDDGIRVGFEGDGAPEDQSFDRILVAVGRRPNGGDLGAEAAGLEVDEHGFLAVDERMRTNVPHIHAIGDVVGGPMLAHKASHEAKVAAEAIAGDAAAAFDARSIPSVAYTDPEVAWTGLTETEAQQRGIDYEKGTFPWSASGRALSIGRSEGMTKLLVEPGSGRVLGAGIVGVNAGELIAEVAHAIEMGADAQDVALTVHPHPTLSETVGFSAEAALGTITDLPPSRRQSGKG